MRCRVRPEFLDTPKIFLPIRHHGRSDSLFRHTLDGILSLRPGAVSILASRYPDCGPELIVKETSGFRGDQHVAVVWDQSEAPLGTARALNQVAQSCGLPILIVATADTIFPFMKLPMALEAHTSDRVKATWVITTDPGPIVQNAGCLLFEESKRRLEFSKESPFSSPEELTSVRPGLVEGTSTGVIILSRSFYRDRFSELEPRFPSQPIDIYRDFMAFLLDNGDEIGIFDVAEPTPDLGTPERFISFEQARIMRNPPWS